MRSRRSCEVNKTSRYEQLEAARSKNRPRNDAKLQLWTSKHGEKPAFPAPHARNKASPSRSVCIVPGQRHAHCDNGRGAKRRLVHNWNLVTNSERKPDLKARSTSIAPPDQPRSVRSGLISSPGRRRRIRHPGGSGTPRRRRIRRLRSRRHRASTKPRATTAHPTRSRTACTKPAAVSR